jgi:hypothetical protein
MIGLHLLNPRGFKGVVTTPFEATSSPLRGVTPLRPLYENKRVIL